MADTNPHLVNQDVTIRNVNLDIDSGVTSFNVISRTSFHIPPLSPSSNDSDIIHLVPSHVTAATHSSDESSHILHNSDLNRDGAVKKVLARSGTLVQERKIKVERWDDGNVKVEKGLGGLWGVSEEEEEETPFPIQRTPPPLTHQQTPPRPSSKHLIALDEWCSPSLSRRHSFSHIPTPKANRLPTPWNGDLLSSPPFKYAEYEDRKSAMDDLFDLDFGIADDSGGSAGGQLEGGVEKIEQEGSDSSTDTVTLQQHDRDATHPNLNTTPNLIDLLDEPVSIIDRGMSEFTLSHNNNRFLTPSFKGPSTTAIDTPLRTSSYPIHPPVFVFGYGTTGMYTPGMNLKLGGFGMNAYSTGEEGIGLGRFPSGAGMASDQGTRGFTNPLNAAGRGEPGGMFAGLEMDGTSGNGFRMGGDPNMGNAGFGRGAGASFGFTPNIVINNYHHGDSNVYHGSVQSNHGTTTISHTNNVTPTSTTTSTIHSPKSTQPPTPPKQSQSRRVSTPPSPPGIPNTSLEPPKTESSPTTSKSNDSGPPPPPPPPPPSVPVISSTSSTTDIKGAMLANLSEFLKNKRVSTPPPPERIAGRGLSPVKSAAPGKLDYKKDIPVNRKLLEEARVASGITGRFRKSDLATGSGDRTSSFVDMGNQQGYAKKQADGTFLSQAGVAFIFFDTSLIDGDKGELMDGYGRVIKGAAGNIARRTDGGGAGENKWNAIRVDMGKRRVFEWDGAGLPYQADGNGVWREFVEVKKNDNSQVSVAGCVGKTGDGHT